MMGESLNADEMGTGRSQYVPGRIKPCPYCKDLVDTWLAGTTYACSTPKGVMHANCYCWSQEPWYRQLWARRKLLAYDVRLVYEGRKLALGEWWWRVVRRGPECP